MCLLLTRIVPIGTFLGTNHDNILSLLLACLHHHTIVFNEEKVKYLIYSTLGHWLNKVRCINVAEYSAFDMSLWKSI